MTSQPAVPKFVRYALVGILALAVATGFIPLRDGSPLPLTGLLDIWLVLLGIASLIGGRVVSPPAIALVGTYALSRVIPAILTQAPPSEFLRAYRWLLYLLVMLLVIGRTWGPTPKISTLTWFLLSTATLKYLLTFAIYGSDVRPILFLENNFEIPLFFGLVIITFKTLGRWRMLAVGMCGIVGLLSQSRSGILAFACLLVFVLFATPGKAKAIRATVVGIPMVGAGTAYVFTSRAEGESSLDRVHFLEVFMDDVKDWDLTNWIFGTPPLTQMNPESCDRLRDYPELLYSTDYNTCYSVILHSFGMRVVYDAGIVGLLLAFGIPLFAMLKANVDKGVALSLMAIAVTNALSVSSINNPYVALPMFLAILCATPRAPGHTVTPGRRRAARIVDPRASVSSTFGSK